MKRMMGFLVAVCLFASASVPASAAPPDAFLEARADFETREAFTSDGNALGYLGTGEEPKQLVLPSRLDAALPTLPRAYDLRTSPPTSRVTPVRNQNPYGTCWAFAAVAAAESNMLTDGMAAPDLSELQLAYFTYSRSAEVATAGGGTSGDVVSYTPVIDRYGTRLSILNRGGLTPNTITAMANHLGLAPESAVPYTTAAAVETSGLPVASAYSADAVHLQNAYVVSMQDRAQVKSLLMTYGAAAIDYYHSNMFLSYTNAAYWYPGGGGTNHAVTLIGWDDAYAASNFNSLYYETSTPNDLPPENGAWICKNSWGTDWGKNGYFYISYADGSLTNATFLDVAPASDYDLLYQYDGGVYSEAAIRSGARKFGAQAAVYTAQKDGYICAVSFYADSTNMSVAADVYTGVTGESPIGGTKAARASASRELRYAGYYTLPLSAPVFVRAGSRFSVVLSLSDADDDLIHFMYDKIGDEYGVTSEPTSDFGRTYWSNDGVDWSDFGTGRGELRIKAHTVDALSSGARGDVNGDGVAGIADAILLCRHVTELDMLSGRHLAAADVNSDNSIDVSDVLVLCKRLAGY